MARGRHEWSQAWSLVLASSAGFGLGLSGLPFYTTGVFVDPLTHAFGWSAAQVQSGLMVMLWSMIPLSPLAGWTADRIGARPVALASVALFGLGFMSLGLTGPDVWAYRLHWVLIAMAGSGTLAVVWSRMVNARFVVDRGLALGLVLAGSGATAFFAPPVAASLIDRFGWRIAYGVLGALPLLIAWPLVFTWFRPAPAPLGSDLTPDASARGVDARRALASPRFWLIALCIGVVSAGVGGCIPNLVRILTAHGQTRATAVWIAGLLGLFVIAGRAISGALVDRFWAPAVACVFLTAPAAGCLLLVHGPPGPAGAAIAAILIGLAAGAEFDLMAYLIAAYFGLRRYGVIYGVASAVFSFGAGAAPVTFAAVFDRTGSFDPILLGAAAMFALGGGGLLLLGPYPLRTQDLG